MLVVGGGPAGLAAAAEAARGGSVLVVHKDAEIGKPVRTSGGSWKKELDRLGIPPHLYQQMRSLTFAGPHRSCVTPFGDDSTVILDVTGTYRYLGDLATKAGARIECSSFFTGMETYGPGRLVAEVETPRGKKRVSARFIVDGSGHRRAVLSNINAASRPTRIGVGAEIEFENKGSDDNCVLFVGSRFAPAGYGWIFPTPGGRIRVGIGVIRPDSAAVPARLLDEFLRSDEARTMGLQVGAPIERHSGVIPSDGPGDQLVVGRVVAVGDSVGQALPIVGEGIRYCIEAGRVAGQSLMKALADEPNYQRHLQSYGAWWKNRHLRTFRMGQAINLRLSAYRDDQWDEKMEFLSALNGDGMAAFLRMEFSARHAAGTFLRHPATVIRYTTRHLTNRIRGLPGRRSDARVEN